MTRISAVGALACSHEIEPECICVSLCQYTPSIKIYKLTQCLRLLNILYAHCWVACERGSPGHESCYFCCVLLNQEHKCNSGFYPCTKQSFSWRKAHAFPCAVHSFHIKCVYVWLYVCIYVCMHVCMYVCMYVWIDGCMDARMHVCIYVCTVNGVQMETVMI